MAKSSDINFLYSGPLSGVTLDDGREVMLHPGASVVLPADNDYVKTLVAQKLLTEIAPEEIPQIPPNPPFVKGGAKGDTQTTGIKEAASAN